MSEMDNTPESAPDVPQTPPPAVPAQPQQHVWIAPPQQKPGLIRRIFRKVFWGIFIMSILLNLYLVALIAAMAGSDMTSTVISDGKFDQVVAVYEVSGVIDDESVWEFGQFFRKVRDDGAIKAVVVRVNSPGGGVSASDQIHRMVKSISSDFDKPVVISMGGVAASGGYYISAPADAIYAEPTTRTASIGVITLMPIVKGFLEKHGVEFITIRSTQAQRWKVALSPFEVPDTEILNNHQAALDKMHERFVKIVREGRGVKLRTEEVVVTVKDFDGNEVKRTQIDPLNGRVLMADRAKEVGLVDEIGYLSDAIGEAAKLANLSRPKVIAFAKRPQFLERMGFATPAPAVDIKVVEKYLKPQMLMLWDGR